MSHETKSLGSAARSDLSGRPHSGRDRWPQSAALWLVFALLAGYLAVFFSTPLPSLFGDVRWARLRDVIVLPEDYLQHTFNAAGGAFPLDRIPLVIVSCGMLLTAWALGALLLGWTHIDRGLRSLERFVFACGVGLNAISLYVLALGLAGRLDDRRLFLAPAGFFVLLAAWQQWRRKQNAGAEIDDRVPPDSENDWLDRRWLWLMAPFLAAIFLGGMLPPVEFDVREYHLEAPKEFYLNGRITFLPHNVYGNMAMGSEMFSLLGMVLMGDWWFGALAGKAVIAAFAPLTVLALIAAGRRFFTPTIGYLAAMIFVSTPWVAHVSTTGLVEGASAFYLSLALYAVMLWRRKAPEQQDSFSAGKLALAGFLAGAAVSCKYPAALFVALPLTAWVAASGGRSGWKAAIVFLLAVFAGCGLWFGKNWALAGNPVYPLFFDWFGGATRTAAKDAQWARAHYPHGFGWDRLAADLAGVFWRSEWLSPLLMPLAALSLAVAKYRRAALVLWAYFAYILVAWWLLTHRIDRFWIPALPVVALLAGIGATWASSQAWRRAALGLLLCGMTLNLLFVVTPHRGFDTAYFASLAQLREAPYRIGDLWRLYLNDHVPRGWKVLAVGEAEVFDYEPLVIYNTVFDDSAFEDVCQNRTPAELKAELLARRVSCIYVQWGEIRRYRQPGNYGFPESINQACFERLVREGVLERPIRSRFDQGEVYLVCDAAAMLSSMPPADKPPESARLNSQLQDVSESKAPRESPRAR